LRGVRKHTVIFVLLNYVKHDKKCVLFCSVLFCSVLFCTTSIRKHLAPIRCAVCAQDARRDACLCICKVAAVNVCLTKLLIDKTCPQYRISQSFILPFDRYHTRAVRPSTDGHTRLMGLCVRLLTTSAPRDGLKKIYIQK